MSVARIKTMAQLRPLVLQALAMRQEVPLLVLRLSQRRLDRGIVTAFAAAAERLVREGDALAHEPDGDWFAIALLAPARGPVSGFTLDVRSALERIAAAMSLVTGERVETGWWPLADVAELDGFAATLARALERGARERERYEFLATIGHELRTPLTSIRGYVETLLESDLDAATARRFLEIVRNEALRLGRLVEGMIDFSPLDLSAQPMPGFTDVAAVACAAAEALAPIARDARMRLDVLATRPVVAKVSVDACMHVLLNVIENAIKYASPGGRIAVSFDVEEAAVRAIVDDDGPGVPSVERERIFSRRARGPGSGARAGSGIGLAIVRTIVERAGGSVCASSSPLGGARFVIALPAAQAEFVLGAS
jgi:two-component system, OmpR family, sensor kinase